MDATRNQQRRRQRQQLGLFWTMVMQAIVIYNTIRRRNRQLPRAPHRNWDSEREMTLRRMFGTNVTEENVNEVDMENVEMDPSPIHGRKRIAKEGNNKAKRRRAQPVDESTIALSMIAESATKIAQAMEMQAMLDAQNHVNWQLILEKLKAMNLDMKDVMEVMEAFRCDDGLAKVFMNLTCEKYMRALVFDKLGRDPPPLM